MAISQSVNQLTNQSTPRKLHGLPKFKVEVQTINLLVLSHVLSSRPDHQSDARYTPCHGDGVHEHMY